MEHKDSQKTGSRVLVFRPKDKQKLGVIAGRLVNYGYKLTEESESDSHCNSIYLNIGDEKSNIIEPKCFIYTQHSRLDGYPIYSLKEEVEEALMIARKASYKTEEDLWTEDTTDFTFKDNKVLGNKEKEGKLEYELDWDFITMMAERMAVNKSKYGKGNWKKPIDVEELKQSLFRHTIETMRGNYKDGEEELGHLTAIALNAMFITHQLKNK